ncbi:MAG: alpha/beta fold hydrolase [Candidatus Micrarchaeaceae archaeon]
MDYDKDFEDGYEYTSLGALHYMHHPGIAKKIIFLHGLGSNTKAWAKLVGFLPDDLDVFLIDLLGHGKSDAPDIEYTVSAQFQALREFIALRNNGDSYIFGHSYGGWIAAYYATQPCSCKGIILEDSAGLKEQLDAIESAGKEKYIEGMLHMLLSMNNNKESVFRSILESDFNDDRLTSDELSMISAKTQLIWGSDDKLVERRYADSFKDNIKGSTLDIIDGAGHEPHFTNPNEVFGILAKFMEL